MSKASIPRHSLQVTYSASPLAARHARGRLHDAIIEWQGEFGIPGEELLIACGEAVSNAYRHGCTRPSDFIRFSASYCPAARVCVVEVADLGPGFPVDLPFRVEPYQGVCLCGRFLMGKCATVSYRREGAFFVCRMAKTL